MIAKGVDRELYAVGLAPAERDDVLAVLEDPPAGLVELRGKLVRDHRKRDDGFRAPQMGKLKAMTEIETVPYLVHFPDRDKSAVHNIEIGRIAEVGTEILDGWVVDEIKQIDEIIDEKSVAYAVWVRPRLTH